MENQVKRYDAVNILRIMCAYLVIMIHTVTFQQQPISNSIMYVICQSVCRISVPFFFIAAGYFFYPKVNKEGYLKKYIMKLIKIYLVATIIYSMVFGPITFPMFNQNRIKFILQTFLVNGISPTLWYFPALIISIAFVYIFLKKNLIKSLMVISVILLLIGLMGDSYYKLILRTPFLHIVDTYDSIFDNTRNGITFGVPFITIGSLINKYEINQKIKRSVILLAVSCIIFGTEAYLLMHNKIPKDYNIYFSVTLVSSIMFIMALNSKISLSDKVSSYLREMSLWIYVYHMFFIVTFTMILNIAPKNMMLMYLLICGISTVLAFIITKIKFRKKVFNKINEHNVVSI